MSSKKVLIAIDAGHGLKTSGKRCLKSLDRYETREWYLNDRIADKLQDLLSIYNCDTLRVDDTTGAKDISLSARVKAANNRAADMYISIHHNAGLNGKAGGGTIVYYNSNNSERVLQAKALYNSIVGMTGLKGNRSSKIINYGFYVIKNTKMPSFLIENGFMDSPTDVPIILSTAHAEKTAVGILNFLVDALSLDKKDNEKLIPAYFHVKVIADLLNVRLGPGTEYKKIDTQLKKGNTVYTIIEVVNNWGKLKSGIGWINLKYTERVQ